MLELFSYCLLLENENELNQLYLISSLFRFEDNTLVLVAHLVGFYLIIFNYLHKLHRSVQKS